MTGADRLPVGQPGERGYTLIAVLWGLAVLSAIAFTIVQSGRSDVLRARNILAAEHARLLAEDGIEIGRAALVGAAADLTRPEGPYAHEFTVEGGRISVALSDETGRIDLNTPSDALIEALFASLGLGPEAAQAMRARIADFRDPDGDPSEGGAEAADYAAMGRPRGPKNAPFDHVSELRGVPGMTEALFAKAAPALTVLSGQAGFDPAFAPEPVLRALPGIADSDLRQLATLKAAGATPEEVRLFVMTRAEWAPFLSAAPGRFTTILSTGISEGGSMRHIEAVADTRRREVGFAPFVSWAE